MTKNYIKLLSMGIMFVFLGFGKTAIAQVTISGYVTDAENGEPLFGANVVLDGTVKGASTNIEGYYEINNVEQGDYVLKATLVGHREIRHDISVGSSNMEVNFELELLNVGLEALSVFASRSDQKTPVAFTELNREQVETQLGSRDLPLILSVTPSVYATEQGGGAGDARINVRGFDQRNVAVMINGVPVNDMENGWVYWSNWDGVGDVASSIQVQRGMSNVNLATPSVGGTLNILTDPASNDKGGRFKQEIGSGGFKKSSIMLNTGLINDKFAFSAVGVRKTGDGIVNGTWTDSYSYYLGASYQVNDKNRLDLFALGAPQRHGQNLYAQNIGTYSESFARSLDGYDNAALGTFYQKGRYYNANINGVSSSYTGNQYTGATWEGPVVKNRYDRSFIMERENFYHKPQVNLNWYSEFSDILSFSNVLYYSGGQGGGSGTLGSIVWDYSHPQRIANWDATIERNSTNPTNPNGESTGILRNSRNNQWTVGNIAKLSADLDQLQLQIGVDWRTAEIEHYREVRDLLGGNFYIDSGDDFRPNRSVGLGDMVDYNFTNTVDWLGGYIQGEYQTDDFSAYATAGYTQIRYKHDNYFTRDPNNTNQYLYRETDWINGGQIKAGALYSFSRNFEAFANIGYITKVPIFDDVIDDRSGAINEDPVNEKFYFYEAGVHVYDNAGKFGMNANFYFTDRQDRTFTQGVTQQDGREGIINISGVGQQHYGVELEASYQFSQALRLDFATSHNLWTYTDDVSARYLEDVSQGQYQELDLYISDLRVGNAPQTQYAYTLAVQPTAELEVQLIGKTFLRHYADFNPLDRQDPNDRAQTWKTPNYSVFDMHLNYRLDSIFQGTRLFVNVFNLFDEVYVQDATDNSRFNAYRVNGEIVNPHSADAAEVFLGLPRRFNAGFAIDF